MLVTPVRFDPRGEALVDEGRPLRVFGGIPGESAQVRVIGRGGHRDYAEWVGAPEPSPARVDPVCARYGRCGGCAWMHLDGAAAREARRVRVAEALAAAGVRCADGGVLAVDPVVPCPDGDEGYRALVKLVARPDPAGVRFGAYGRDSHDVVSVAGCAVLAEPLRPWTHLKLPISSEILRYMVVRRSRSTGAVLATLVARRDDPALRRLAERLDADGVHLHVNSRDGDSIFDPAGPTHVLRGVRTLEERVGDVVLDVGPTDFFQTNPSTAARIWAELPRPTGTMLDLFCGVGAVALSVGRGASRVHGVEYAHAAVERARRNAERNGVSATFTAGPVATADIPPGFEEGDIFVNPPRAGLGVAGVERVRALRPRRLVYVSCEPRTLGRDLAGLLTDGLVVRRVTPYDMFPHTPHVETVVVAERPGT